MASGINPRVSPRTYADSTVDGGAVNKSKKKKTRPTGKKSATTGTTRSGRTENRKREVNADTVERKSKQPAVMTPETPVAAPKAATQNPKVSLWSKFTRKNAAETTVAPVKTEGKKAAAQSKSANTNQAENNGPKNTFVRKLLGQADLFDIEGKKDTEFLYGLKWIINKVWSTKHISIPAATGAAGIAVGVGFIVLHHAVIFSTLGAFFSSPVGWGVAAGVGGLLLAVGLFTLVRFIQHKQELAVKAEETRVANHYDNKVAGLEEVIKKSKNAQTIAEMKQQIAELKGNLEEAQSSAAVDQSGEVKELRHEIAGLRAEACTNKEALKQLDTELKKAKELGAQQYQEARSAGQREGYEEAFSDAKAEAERRPSATLSDLINMRIPAAAKGKSAAKVPAAPSDGHTASDTDETGSWESSREA